MSYVSTPCTRAADVPAAIQRPEAVIAALPEAFLASRQEEVWLITVDAGLRPIGTYMVSRGGRASCPVDRAVVARHAILDLAAGAFLVHNHPSGDPTPSALDRKVTSAVKDGLALFDIELFDHLVVTADGLWASAASFNRSPSRRRAA